MLYPLIFILLIIIHIPTYLVYMLLIGGPNVTKTSVISSYILISILLMIDLIFLIKAFNYYK